MQETFPRVQTILPHQHPFIFVDEILQLSPMQQSTITKNFSENEWFFEAHFPGDPVVPGSLQIEAYTQAVAITILADKTLKCNFIRLISVDRARFLKAVFPGDKLKLISKIDKIAMNIITATARGFVDDVLVSECKIGYKLETKQDE